MFGPNGEVRLGVVERPFRFKSMTQQQLLDVRQLYLDQVVYTDRLFGGFLAQLKDRALYERMVWQFADPNGTLGKRSIEDQIAWYQRHGMLTKPVAYEQVVETRYLDAALKQLGTVACPRCVR